VADNWLEDRAGEAFRTGLAKAAAKMHAQLRTT
jgi:hypothetical protein